MKMNDTTAEANRQQLKGRGIYGVNIMASPGAGKTSVIMQAIKNFKGQLPVMVVEGDVASTIDADKINDTGTPVIQINTNGGCHLDASQIHGALEAMDLVDGGVLFIENVGNLICPSTWALGEELRLVIASVAEGHDKPFKYPGMFACADAIVLNKVDLAPYFDFDQDAFVRGIRAVNAEAPIFPLSCRTGEGVVEWLTWLKDKAHNKSAE
jgi:hydrogenase nickel incorporation protein HypB